MTRGEGPDGNEGTAFKKRSIENVEPTVKPDIDESQRTHKKSKQLSLSPLAVPSREFALAVPIPTIDSPFHDSPCSTPSLSPRPRKVAFRCPPEVSPAEINRGSEMAQISDAVIVNQCHKFEAAAPMKQAAPSRRGGRGCRCGRTRCLKQYCLCFRADSRCTDECICENCYNDGKHEIERIQAVRNIRASNALGFNASAAVSNGLNRDLVCTLVNGLRAVRGCRCRKSKCQKKYCECYGAGLKCSVSCQCEECRNGSADDQGEGPSKKPLVNGKPLQGVLKKKSKVADDPNDASSCSSSSDANSTPPSCGPSASGLESTAVVRSWRGKGKIGLSSCDWYHEEKDWERVVGGAKWQEDENENEHQAKWHEDENENEHQDEDGGGHGPPALSRVNSTVFMSPPKTSGVEGKSYFDAYGAPDEAPALVRGESLLTSDEPVCTPITSHTGMFPPPWACGAMVADDVMPGEDGHVPIQPCSWGLARNDSVDLVLV